MQKGDSGSGRATAPKLGPFASSVLQVTDLDNRCMCLVTSDVPRVLTQVTDPTPTSPEKKIKPQVASVVITSQPESSPRSLKLDQSTSMSYNYVQTIQQQSPITPSVQHYVQNDTAFSKNSNFSGKNSHPQIATHSVSTPKVVIPMSSSKAYASDFVTYEESPARDGNENSKKRKHEGEPNYGTNSSPTKDQRTASNESLSQLRVLVQDIFEAEDQSQSNIPAADAYIRSQFLIPALHEEQETLTISSATHVRLETLLHKLLNVGRFGDVPVDDLLRLQRLCEGSLTAADALDLQIDSSWVAEGFASWVSRLETLDAALRSAKTVMRIITGEREEKQLYSEELLQSVLKVVKKALDNVIVPIIEARSSGTTSNIFEGVTEHKKVVSQLLYDTIKVMTLLVSLLAKVEMAETIVTGIEFLATPLLFVESSYNEKDSVLGNHKIESLRRTAMDLISTIFLRYSEQRNFLFNEILTSMQKLPVNEKHARQYKLTEGRSIMLVSALIMELVQTNAKFSSGVRKQATHESDLGDKKDQEDINGSSDEELSEPTKFPQESSMLEGLRRDANFFVDNATKGAQYVVTFLMQRASGTAKTGESPHRQHLDIFVQDLIAVLGAPEWPAAELLLRMVFASCRNVAESPKSSAPAKNMALELLGMMGSAISDLVSNTRQMAKSLDSQDSALNDHLRQMLDDFSEGSLESGDLVVWEGPYHTVVEHLQRTNLDDTQSTSAQAFHLAQWAKALTFCNPKANSDSSKLVLKLQQTLSGVTWVTSR